MLAESAWRSGCSFVPRSRRTSSNRSRRGSRRSIRGSTVGRALGHRVWQSGRVLHGEPPGDRRARARMQTRSSARCATCLRGPARPQGDAEAPGVSDHRRLEAQLPRPIRKAARQRRHGSRAVGRLRHRMPSGTRRVRLEQRGTWRTLNEEGSRGAATACSQDGGAAAAAPAVRRVGRSRGVPAPTVEAAVDLHRVPGTSSRRSRGDRRTGDPPETSRRSLRRSKRDLEGSRPFPRDRLLVAARFTADSLEHLLDRHRHQNRQDHERSRSISFAGRYPIDGVACRQPGRNIREKLSGRTHALGVKRDVSVDTTENRLLGRSPSFSFGAPAPGWTTETPTTGRPRDVERVRRLEVRSPLR